MGGWNMCCAFGGVRKLHSSIRMSRYGICCVFMASCGGIARENGTYFVNPNSPDVTDGTGSCQLSILKLHPDICQLRLDFENFAIAGPDVLNHICNTDQFLVSGGSTVPTICGTNHGDHMYIDAGLGQSNPVILTVITSGPTFPRSWRIRISQIHCGSLHKADQGCLQYFTGISGRVKSFNYDSLSGRQLSNQDYSICIRTERNFCSIQYTACGDAIDSDRKRSFTLSGNSNSVVPAMLGGGIQSQSNSCPNDWLMVPCAKVADRVPPAIQCEDKICGGTFNAEPSTTERTVSSNIRPFRLAFHTDSVEAPTDVDNKGFCLDYVQQPCTNA
ncbi:CLUMA_CG016282, isoform A [Clunio marinus]|uniref:CLUMA_CG016282, isoform A n=1 Tax=Clunio marinus TaxID=568069 RepID=A0A1J1ISJ9_9DIPT|nr:CLUMA_CG016282, isoform A [Clunio marinus]